MMRRWRLLLPLLFVLLLGGWWLVGAFSRPGGSWSAARRDDLVLGAEVNGTLHAVDSSTLGPPGLRRYYNFKIAYMAPEGESVSAGTVVLGFDTTELEQKLLQQQAEAQSAAKKIEQNEKKLAMQHRDDELRVAEAEARERRARMIVDTPAEFAEAGELTKARLDLELATKERRYLAARLTAARNSAESQLRALRAQKERAEQRVAEIQQSIEQMSRTAERDGTVIYVRGWNGEAKKVGDSCWRQEQVIELPDLKAMLASGKVDESDAGRLAEGQRVTLRLDAHPDVEFEGRIQSIWSTVQQESWSNPIKVVRLDIELAETDTQRMRPGMRFRGRVELERVEGALLIPLEAVFRTVEGAVVYRRSVMGHDVVPVELGRRDDDRVEVLAGLDEGDSVSLIDLGRS